MEFQRTNNFDDGAGIPEDLRCKRSDGKQWRCSALSMPDKTVCEKHYIQAKKRAANSAMRANMKKAWRKPKDDTDVYMDDTPNDDMELPFETGSGVDFSSSVPLKRHKDRASKSRPSYSPDIVAAKGLGIHNLENSGDGLLGDTTYGDESKSKFTHKTSSSATDIFKNNMQRGFNGVAHGDLSGRSTDSSEGAVGRTCHQCRINGRETLVWCRRCNRKGYCGVCISKWYPDIPPEEIRKACPACCGACSCKACFRPDSLIKTRIREIAPRVKLQYLHYLLSLVLPVLRGVHQEQSSELDLESRLHGPRTDLPRTRLNPDEQMCCDCCKVPIIDYHRHCPSCLYDLCLTCCRVLRQAHLPGVGAELEDSRSVEKSQGEDCPTSAQKSSNTLAQSGLFNVLSISPDWKANSDGSIPCPPKESGGCGCQSLTLRRIYKMNWVAKLVKNAEEMVNGCKVNDMNEPQACFSCSGAMNFESSGSRGSNLIEASRRNDSDDNFLYCPAPKDIKCDHIGHFQKHWRKGEPIIVKSMADFVSTKSWEPTVLWSGIQDATEDSLSKDNNIVKAIDCFDWSEVEIEVTHFIKGYLEGRFCQDDQKELLILKDWPFPNAIEEFLYYQRPDFISRLPLLEYIHPKWGFLNLAAKLPHESLQPDMGLKLIMAYGMSKELNRGNSVIHLRTSMGDVVYLMMHTAEVKCEGLREAMNVDSHEKCGSPVEKKIFRDGDKIEPQANLDNGGRLADIASDEPNETIRYRLELNNKLDEVMEGQTSCENIITSDEEKGVNQALPDNCDEGSDSGTKHAGVLWDVFRRQDVPKVNEYLRNHWQEFEFSSMLSIDSLGPHPAFEKFVFLSRAHIRRLKEEFDIEPWTFEQHIHEAVLIPAGCSFQARYLQSSIQLAFDFLTPESLGDSMRLAQDIRCLPNDHEAKLQMLEVGKMSLYAASSAIREIQKLTLDSNRVSSELGAEDRNLTALVSENIENMGKRNQIPCV